MKKLFLFIILAMGSSFLALQPTKFNPAKLAKMGKFDKGIDLPECVKSCEDSLRELLTDLSYDDKTACWDFCLEEHFESSIT